MQIVNRGSVKFLDHKTIEVSTNGDKDLIEKYYDVNSKVFKFGDKILKQVKSNDELIDRVPYRDRSVQVTINQPMLNKRVMNSSINHIIKPKVMKNIESIPHLLDYNLSAISTILKKIKSEPNIVPIFDPHRIIKKLQ